MNVTALLRFVTIVKSTSILLHKMDFKQFWLVLSVHPKPKKVEYYKLLLIS